LNPVDAYATDVVTKKIPAGKYHRLSCARHLADRKREGTPGFPFVFSMDQAERFLRFARMMKHYKGRQFAGKPFDPTPCQVFRLGSVFGWRHQATGHRRFTTAYIDQPRKQGKSFESAAVLVYASFFEGEPGAEGYCIATKEHQARIVFGDAKKLVQSAGLGSRLQVNAWNLSHEKSSSFCRPLGSDSDTTDGLNPQVVVVDEMHAMKTRALLDVMESATGARINPLFYEITTHGDDLVSPWGDQMTYAQQILDGTLEDDPSTLSFFAFIAHADIGDDPFDRDTWIKANPHWGISVNPEDFEKLAAKARKMPSAAAEFKQKRLNMLPEASSPWLSMEGWRAGQRSTPTALAEELIGRRCWVGLDLASKLDLAALVAVFPPEESGGEWNLLRWVWTPAETLKDRAHRDRAPYEVWAQQGHLIALPGTSIDHAPIRAALVSLRERYEVVKVGCDPWHLHQLHRDLVSIDGFEQTDVLEVPQTYSGLSAASLELESEVLAGRVNAGGCPVMTWTFANAVVQRDGKDNIQPIKKRSRGRIDPVVATCSAIALWKKEPAKETSVYLTRGIRVLGQ
jgi:phage terminase large subunit-like protein